MIAKALHGIALCVIMAISFISVAFAQVDYTPGGGPDYAKWESLAKRAEEVIAADRASSDALEVLRENLAEWRSAFVSRQSVNSSRIDTLNDQLRALGTPPSEGVSESEEIAARRAELEASLAEARTPVLRAEEAYRRADGLVGEVDGLVRARQTNRTLKLDPSPLNPANWGAASKAVIGLGAKVLGEFEENSRSAVRVQSFKDNLPLSLGLLVVGMVLVSRSSSWIQRGLTRMRERTTENRASRRVGTFIASAFGLLLPFAGLAMLFGAIELSEFFGPVTVTLSDEIMGVLLSIFAALWLGREVFPKAYPPSPIIPLDAPMLKRGRTYTTMLGALIGFDYLFTALASETLIARQWSDAAVAVLRFPVLVLAGLLLFRMGQLLLASRSSQTDAASEQAQDERANLPEDVQDLERPPSSLLIAFVARVGMVIGVLGPILAAIGYVSAGGFLLTSSILTLGLLGVVAVLQRFIRDIFAMFMGEDASGAALIPVLVGFALVLLALPVLALIWGARTTDINDTWSYLTTGFSIGDTRISLTDFATFLVIFFLGYGVTKLLQSTLRMQVLPKTSLDTGGRNAIVSGTGYVGIFLAALLAITGAGIDLSSLAIVAGALSVGIGFGLQTIVSNFVSGIILLIERPISEGDWIEVGPTMGVVKKIAVRATTIETFDRTEVIVPNADLIAGSVTNWTKDNLTGRVILPVGVAYGSDTRKVEEILREIAEAHPMVIVVPPPSILFMGFGADSMDFEIRAILRDVGSGMSARSDMNHEIARRFAEEGIEVPFAQRDLWLRNPEALAQMVTPK